MLTEQPWRVMPPQVAGDAVSGDAADAGADLLDRHHQRIAEHQRPGQAKAELRADLRIGRDTAGIVVRCASDQAGAHDLYKLRATALLRSIV